MKTLLPVTAGTASLRSAGIRFASRSPAPLYGVGRTLLPSQASAEAASVASLLLLAALVPLLCN